ncbi:hypothetical protein LSCM1_01374 [Leishmania martiniquensis]|uniref:Uncharacterized protein n=1 Tax=Leishmania martiniquensis TaxID=1580590 RepID=A0A836GD71_9TRYP|nr:hypothetical protein LSCM1_01374 [Leishmania martiniquensis]
MPQTHLTQHQRTRAQYVSTMHEQLKALSLATKEALTYYDKYLVAMEKVMGCLVKSSAAVDDMERYLELKGTAGAPPLSQMSGCLAAAYSRWHTSAELNMMRTELDFLQEVSTTGRRIAKQTKNASAVLDKAAKKCATVNSPKFEAKASCSSGKRLEKLLREQQERNTEMKKIEKAVADDVASLTTSCSTKLATRGRALYAAFASIGHRTLVCFPDVCLNPSPKAPTGENASAPLPAPPPSSANPTKPHHEDKPPDADAPPLSQPAPSADCAEARLGSASEAANSGVQLEPSPRESGAGKP